MRPAVGVPLLTALVAGLSFLHRDYELDDALIYYRYIRNFLEGHGLVYNPGEYFNALTSPLHTYVSIAICGALGSIPYPMVLLSGLCIAGTAIALFHVYARNEELWGFVLAGAAVIAGSRFFYSVYGMETPLFLLLSAICLLLYRRRAMFWLGIGCALLVLTRGEGALLVLALGGVHLARGRPLPRPREWIVPAVLLAGNATFNRAYYGSFLPHTLTAKVQQGRSGLWGEWPLFLRPGDSLEYFADSRAVLATCLVLAVVGAARLGRRDVNWIVLAYLGALTVFYVVLNVPNYHWYYAPFYAFGSLYVGLGAASLFSLSRRLRAASLARLAQAGVVVAVLGLLILLVDSNVRRPYGDARRQRDYPILGRWLKNNTPPDATVALVEVGIIGYHSERRIVDILGLVSPGNAESLGNRRFAEWLERYDPDFILVHHPMVPHERGVEESLRRGIYGVYQPFEIPGYALLVREEPAEPARMERAP